VCQIFGTLIGDEQQVYDLSYLDDQLVLGIKGTLSVVELKVLRQRMQAGQESKARRGELSLIIRLRWMVFVRSVWTYSIRKNASN
jgi:DNA invertase Pin-like site-specific DNA recombinase